MAYIYKITNDINNKIYVGKTEFSIEKRFQEHCRDAYRERNEKRPLYAAMRKYGTEHFHIELIEETENPNEREIYWIEVFRSFKEGYNATIGGDGKRYLDYDLIIATYYETESTVETAKKCNICVDTVRDILKANNIEPIPSQLVNLRKHGKIVNQYDMNMNFIQSFPSVRAAARALNTEGFSHISAACRGKRQSAYGFKWQYAN